MLKIFKFPNEQAPISAYCKLNLEHLLSSGQKKIHEWLFIDVIVWCDGHPPRDTHSPARMFKASSCFPKLERFFEFRMTATYEGVIKSIKSYHSCILINKPGSHSRSLSSKLGSPEGLQCDWPGCLLSIPPFLSEITILRGSSSSEEHPEPRGDETKKCSNYQWA